MEESKERKFMCNFCYKKFPSGKSLGGHIRIHSNLNSVDSNRYAGKKNKRLVDQRKKQQQQQQHICRKCGKEYVSSRALCTHMALHSAREKMAMDSQSGTATSSAPFRKRSERVMRQSNSEAFSDGGSYFASEIDQEVKDGAFNLMVMSSGSTFKEGHNLVMNSLGESSDNNSVILETKSSSGKELKIFKNHVLQTDKVSVDDQLRSADDSDSSDSDYFMNGPKESDSDISFDGSLRNTGFGSGFNSSFEIFRNSDVGRSKYDLSKSERLPSYETDSCETHRSRDSKSPVVNKASGGRKKAKATRARFASR